MNRGRGRGTKFQQVLLDPGSKVDVKTEKLFNKIIEDNKILDEILSYLSLSEQKDFLSSSKVLSNAVRKRASFQKLTKLLVCEKSYSTNVLKTCSGFEWMTISVELERLPLKALDYIKLLVRHAETLEFHLVNGHSQEMITLSVTHCMMEILISAHKVTSLKIDCTLMEKELKSVFTDMRVQIRLRNVQHLTFVNPCAKPDSSSHLEDFEVLSKGAENKMYKIQGTYGLWTRNFNHLLQIPMALKTLHVGKITAGKKSHLAVLAALVNNNTLSLKDLTISADMWTEGINNFAFPSLSSLKLRAHQTDEDVVRKYLLAQPALEYVDVGFVSAFPLSVLTLIQGKSSASKLKSLHLKCKYFVDSLDPLNWMFLKSLRKLEEFELRMARYVQPTNTNPPALISPTDFISVISNLPKSVKRITLSGLRCKKIMDKTYQSIIANFDHLTDLNVMNCPELVDDTLLQLLFAKNSHLQKLKFSYCSNVTPFGLTGIRDNGSSTGYSLKNLTYLREFAMKECSCILFEHLVSVLEFKHLRILEIYTFKKVTSSMIFDVLKRNPSLETISVNISAEDCNEVTSNMKCVNHRVSQVLRIVDASDFASEGIEKDSSDDDEDGYKRPGPGNANFGVSEESAVEGSAKSIAAKKMAAKFADLNFDDDEVACDDLSRFDSEDDDFDGCDYIPG